MISDPLTKTADAASQAEIPACQYCATPLSISWIDLGRQPLSNNYGVSREAALAAPHYPLHARTCSNCWLVQVDSVVLPEDIFSDYAYFSSYSDSWLAHCRDYAAAIADRFGLTHDDLVVEVASNDGYQLKYFAESGIRVLGIDPAANVAKVAIDAGIPTEVDFFGADLARRLVARGAGADHLSAKNVMAHVPDIGDFADGVAILLKPQAVFTVEFPHLLETMQRMQFDQIYHEHFTYLSLVAVRRIFADNGMRVFDVEQVETHGGSLRVFICHDGARHETTAAVERVLGAETAAGLDREEGYAGYNERVAAIRRDFIDLLATAQDEGKMVAGYGAAAKGNTFLNYCEAGPDTLAFIADRSTAKAGKFMPGSGIPILTPDAIDEQRPSYLVILPWNLSHEIAGQMALIRDWGGQFVTAIPKSASSDAKARGVMTILTGASGFIGARVARLLHARGDDVVAIGRTPAVGLPFRQIDLLGDDPRPLLRELAATRLIHLAWNADRATLWNGAENLAWVAATLRLVLAFREAKGERAVIAGSSAEYDWSCELLEEGVTPLKPHTGYGTAKRALHNLLSGTPPTLAPLSIGWARLFFPFGPYDKPDRLLSQVIDGVAAGRPVALSSGEQVRPFIHVDDAAAALVALLDSAVEGPVNIALDETASVRDLALMAVTGAGDAALLRFGDRRLKPGEPRVMRAAVSRLTVEVGFRPRYTIREGVAATVADRLADAVR